MSFNPTGSILCQRCENFVDGHDCVKCGWEQPSYQEDPLDKANARIEELEEELEESRKSDECFNAVISYMLYKGYMESPLEFLRCWNEGNFQALREEWPDAPEEIYFADALYKGKK